MKKLFKRKSGLKKKYDALVEVEGDDVEQKEEKSLFEKVWSD